MQNFLSSNTDKEDLVTEVYGCIAIEEIQVKRMMNNSKLESSIAANMGFYEFRG
ncbi:MAG: hypothetical protein AB8C84_00355 [Oligoflexales bacterium]